MANQALTLLPAPYVPPATMGTSIGWVIEHDYAFGSTDQNVISVISKITAENRLVRDQPGVPGRNPMCGSECSCP